MFALMTGIGAVSAQEQVTTENTPTTVQTDGAKEEPGKIALQKEVYPQKEEDGDLYHGLTKKAHVRPHDSAARLGGYLRQDRTRHLSGGGALRRSRLAEPYRGQG